MARKRNSKASPLAAKVFLILILIIGLGLLLYKAYAVFIQDADYFKVRTIMVSPSLQFLDRQSLERVLKDCDRLKGRSIFLIPLKDVQTRLSDKYPQIPGLKIVRRLPDQIELMARKRYPLAQITVQSRVITLDDQGLVLSVNNPLDRNLPLIAGLSYNRQNLGLGASLRNYQFQAAYIIIQSFKKEASLAKLKLVQVDVSNPSAINLGLSNNLKVILDTEKNDQRLKILGMLLSQGKLNLNQVKYIDLRFNEPIIGKNNAE